MESHVDVVVEDHETSASTVRAELMAPTAARVPGQGPAGFAVRSRFVIANGMEEEVRAAFRSRPHLVDSAAGFLRMEVLSPLDRPAEIWLMTWWASHQDYRDWHAGHGYHASHAGIPKGLKLVGKETQIQPLEVICC
jgi:heme-degrading monooxygenase HmoA